MKYEMITDTAYGMTFYRLKSLFISMKNYIVVTDVVITLIVPVESVM